MLPIPENEEARIAALYALRLLDTEPEAEFDEVVHLAAAICGTPVSLVTLIDEQRQWFKSRNGTGIQQTSRDISFCAHTIMQPEIMVVPDATKDERFANNPMVAGEPHVRFYAGVPLSTPEGHNVGTLCVLDTVPRMLTQSQGHALGVLARQIRTILELRLQRRLLHESLEQNQEMAQGLRASDAIFRAFMNNSPMLSFMKDEHSRFLFYNRRFAECFKIGMQEWIGKTDSEIWPMDQARAFRENDLKVLRDNKPVEYSESTPEPDGSKRLWRSYKFPCSDMHGQRLLACISVDITREMEREASLKQYQLELEEANDRLRKLAMTDMLTGLANRRMFEDRLAVEFSMARRRTRELSLLMIDVDDFKKLNDQYGHPIGDDVLRQLGIIFRRTVRATDLAARYGGEEFAVLLPETDAASAQLLAHRIAEQVKRYDWGMDAPTLSIGVACLDHRCAAPSELVVVADAALYSAKHTGKNRVVTAAA